MSSVSNDFQNIVLEGRPFIDKTLFIEEILCSCAECALITMPRRWGKSTNLMMLKTFLEIQIDENGNAVTDKTSTLQYKLFAGGNVVIGEGPSQKTRKIQPSKLALEAPDLLRYQGQYPVLYFDFKDCFGENPADIELKLSAMKSETIKAFNYLEKSDVDNIFITVSASYKRLVEDSPTLDFGFAMLRLCQLLKAHHRVDVWILVDEYDSAFTRAYLEYNDTSAKQVAYMFEDIYGYLFKGNRCLFRGVLTGVRNLFNGALVRKNNFCTFSIRDSNYSKYYGINEEEMNILFGQFSITEVDKLRMKDWYIGYRENIGCYKNKVFISKYNIWSAINYLNKKEDGFVSYWHKSGIIDFIAPLLNKKEFRERIEILVSGGSVNKNQTRECLTIEDLNALKRIITTGDCEVFGSNDISVVFQYLFVLGYLTEEDFTTDGKLPNKEIIKIFCEYLMRHYEKSLSINPDRAFDLYHFFYKVFETSTVEEIEAVIKTKFGPALENVIRSSCLRSKSDMKQKNSRIIADEVSIHSLLNYIVLQLGTNKLHGYAGVADLVVEINNIGVKFMIKYNDNAEKVLLQSKDNTGMIDHCNTKIFIGCNISKKQRVTLSGEVVQNNGTRYFKYP